METSQQCWAKGCPFPAVELYRDIREDVPTCAQHAIFLDEEKGNFFDEPILRVFQESTEPRSDYRINRETGLTPDDHLALRYPRRRIVSNRRYSGVLADWTVRAALRRQRQRFRENRELEKLARVEERQRFRENRNAARDARRQAWWQHRQLQEAVAPVFSLRFQRLMAERARIHSASRRTQWEYTKSGLAVPVMRQVPMHIVRTQLWQEIERELTKATGVS